MARFHELMEGLRAEYEGLYMEWALYKQQREDYDQKVLGDFGALQKALGDLERAHLRMKQEYIKDY